MSKAKWRKRKWKNSDFHAFLSKLSHLPTHTTLTWFLCLKIIPWEKNQVSKGNGTFLHVMKHIQHPPPHHTHTQIPIKNIKTPYRKIRKTFHFSCDLTWIYTPYFTPLPMTLSESPGRVQPSCLRSLSEAEPAQLQRVPTSPAPLSPGLSSETTASSPRPGGSQSRPQCLTALGPQLFLTMMPGTSGWWKSGRWQTKAWGHEIMVVMAENHQNNKMDSLVQDHGYKTSSSGTQ